MGMFAAHEYRKPHLTRRNSMNAPCPSPTHAATTRTTRTITVGGSPEWTAWVHEAADRLRIDACKLTDLALAAYLERIGHPIPAPRRL